MEKLFYCILLIFALQQSPLFSNNPNNGLVINAGIKVGYALGDKSGYVIGTEITVGSIKQIPMFFYGCVLNCDYLFNKFRFTLSGEIQGWPYPGITVGPSLLLSKNGESHLGLTLGTYGTIGFLSLTYNYSIFDQFIKDSVPNSKSLNIHELVNQFKLPLVMPFELEID